MPDTRSRYQQGSLDRVRRAKGPDVWVYRWRERQPDGRRVQRKKTIGTVKRFKTLSDAQKAVENLRAEANATQTPVAGMTVSDAWGHFQLHELSDPEVNRSPTTILCYKDNFKNWVIPQWGEKAITDVRTVAVEKWLRSLKLAPGTRAKIRNHMSALFNHCIRQEWLTANPIKAVRTSSKRLREPDVLTIDEIRDVLSHIKPEAIRVMTITAAASALRRSEVRGLKWGDLDFDRLWFHLKRGVVRKMETGLKTEASRRGIPMLPELAEVLRQWHDSTPYPGPDDWVFASPRKDGKAPYWPDSALKDHIRPAVAAAKINKHVGWHTFRHSLGTALKNNGEDVKTIQELLRHANSRITTDIYLHGDTDVKRTALSKMSGLFIVKKSA